MRNLTHLPFQNWCPHCVRAKGKDMDHRKVGDKQRGLAEFAFDYCFPGNELGYKLTVLVGRERTTGMSTATTAVLLRRLKEPLSLQSATWSTS